MSWLVYMLECSDQSLYCGITNDITTRIKKHETGLGAKYTRGRGPFRLVYLEECGDCKEAARREAEIKSWPRPKKVQLIKNGNKSVLKLKQ